jgi:CRISPR-associated exonuclease Cas4
MSLANQVQYVPISYLNALAYCPRRFVYEYVQAEMLVNEHVLEGTLRHGPVDRGDTVWGEGVVQQRRVYVWSERLLVAGFVDLVEQRDGKTVPVEYKKGRVGDNDRAQLCAQALCLEERTGKSIALGYLYSFASRRRVEVPFDAALRSWTAELAQEAQRLAAAGILPLPIAKRSKCRDCSLLPICLPDEVTLLSKPEAIHDD